MIVINYYAINNTLLSYYFMWLIMCVNSVKNNFSVLNNIIKEKIN